MTGAVVDRAGLDPRPVGWSLRDEFTRAATWQEAGHMADIWDSVLLLNMPEDVYHARPELSASQMKPLLVSPKHFQEALSAPRVEKSEWDEGHAIHSRVLGIGQPLAEIPVDLLSADGGIRSNAAKAWVQEARDEGKVPLKPDVYHRVVRAADGVLMNPKARRVLLGEGFAEVSMFGIDQATGTRLRGRADYVNLADDDAPFIVDVKSVDARDGSALTTSRLMRIVDQYNYDLQAENYRYLFEYHTGVVARPTVLVFCEKKPPYDVRVVTLDGDWSDGGWTKLRRALDTYARCKESQRWPGIDEDEGPIESLPTSSWYRQQIADDDDNNLEVVSDE